MNETFSEQVETIRVKVLEEHGKHTTNYYTEISSGFFATIRLAEYNVPHVITALQHAQRHCKERGY